MADTELRCYCMTAWTFRPFVRNHPDLAWALLESMVGRVREAQSSELPAASCPRAPQARQALGDLLRRVGGEGEPQRRAVGRAGEERRARDEGDVVLQRAPQQQVGVPAVGQPRPHEHAALGPVVRRAGRQRVARARPAARRAARRTRAAGRPTCASRSTAASQCAAAAWSTVEECRSAACLAIGQRPAQRLGRAHPADAQAGRGHLRERGQRQHAVLGARQRGQGGRRRAA